MLTQEEFGSIDFGNEAADDIEPSDLKSYFVEHPNFQKYLSLKNKFIVATAKKGVGKSALMQWLSLREHYPNDDPLIIKIRGADISRDRLKLSHKLNNSNEYISDWMNRIATIVNRNLGKSLKIALSDDAISLVETAEFDGFKERSLLRTLLDRFKNSFKKLQPDREKISNEIEVLKRFNKNHILFLIDDLDATFQNRQDELLEMSTFFTACRYLIQDVQDISFRVTMRADVWPIIRRFDEALDKVEQYVSEITWSERAFKQLLFKRLKHEFDRNGFRRRKSYYYSYPDNYHLNLVFEKTTNWGNKDVYTYKVLYTLSYHRPRWGIQLCKLAQEESIRNRSSIIKREHIDSAWGMYGTKRIADLISEHKHQCSEITEIINAFRGVERRLSRDELIEIINNKISSHVRITIDGDHIKSPLPIAAFLYRIGFIIARSNKEDGSYVHYHYNQMPDFLTNRTNTDFGMEWEIHPCYRQALNIKKLNESKFRNSR